MPFEAADAWGRKNNRISAFWLFDQQKFTVQAEMVKQRLFLAHDSHQILTLYYFKGRKKYDKNKEAAFPWWSAKNEVKQKLDVEVLFGSFETRQPQKWRCLAVLYTASMSIFMSLFPKTDQY
jgi:hypothetical protein